ncbi:MAG: molybdopterin-dependent oxidoreductase [Deltaproteobacteria bacterium]|nr:molybdopterin-dependent oxidoreductase [Deltaproteobacteria bacterium]
MTRPTARSKKPAASAWSPRAALRTQVQCHTALEPHAAVAAWDGPDRLTVYLSTQSVQMMAHDIAERFELREENVRVVAEHVGGGFGAKATLGPEAIVAIELARTTGAPVRYALERGAEIMLGGNRPGATIEVALATDKAGEMVGLRAKSTSTAGVAVGTVTSVMFRIIYPDAPRDLQDEDVVTHAPAGKPFRGPGGPPAVFALESTVDELAHLRGEDPLAVRKRWDPNPARKPLYAWAEGIPAWRDRGRWPATRVASAAGSGSRARRFAFAGPSTRLQLEITADGLLASCSTQDIGNGSRSSIANLVSHRFDLRPTQVEARIGDSRYVHGLMAGGSRSTRRSQAPATTPAISCKTSWSSSRRGAGTCVGPSATRRASATMAV